MIEGSREYPQYSVFPEIPFIRGKENKKEAMVGAPISAFDSVSLFPEAPAEEILPLFYEFDRTGGNRDIATTQTARFIIGDIESLEPTFRYINGLASISSGERYKKRRRSLTTYSKQVQSHLAEAATESEISFRDEQGKRLLELTSSGDYPEQAAQVVRGVLERGETVTEAVDIMHDFVQSALESDVDDQIRFALRVLSLTTSVMEPTSKLAQQNLLGNFSEDNATLLKALEIDAFLYLLGDIYCQEEFSQRNESLPQTISLIEDDLVQLQRSNPQRLDVLTNYHEHQNLFADLGEGQSLVQMRIQNPSPIRTLTYRKYNDFNMFEGGMELVETTDGPQVYQFSDTEVGQIKAEKGEILLDSLNQIPNFEQQLLDVHQTAEVIKLLHPELKDLDSLYELMTLNTMLKTDLNIDISRFVGKRGVEMIINDPVFNGYGYQSVTFYDSIDYPGNTNGNIRVGNYYINFIFDGNSIIIPNLDELSNESKPSSLDHKIFETMVLGHLHDLMCSDSTPSTGRTDEKEFKGNVHRTGHMRQLTGRQRNYHDVQVRLAREEKGKDLHAINAKRREKDLPQVTYVREIYDADNPPPPIRYNSEPTLLNEFDALFKQEN